MLHVFLGTIVTCGLFMGVELHEGYANPPSNAVSSAKKVMFQPRPRIPSSSNIAADDSILFDHLVEIGSEPESSQALSRPEPIRLPAIQSSPNPFPQFDSRMYFQPTLEWVSPVADLYFDYHRVRLGSDIIEALDASVDTVPPGEVQLIYLEAYCDQRGGMAYSLALASRRMELVRKYFLDLGVPPHRVQAVNYGSSWVACQGSNIQCQESNARIQSTFKFFAILEPQFGCLTRIKVAHPSSISTRTNLPGPPVVHRHIRLAPLSRHR